MIRKIMTFAICSLLLILLAGIKPAEAKFALKLASVAPESTSLIKELRKASKQIKLATNGRVYLKLYPGGVMGSSRVIMRKMRIGQLHGATFTAGQLYSVYPYYQTLSEPLLMRNHKEASAARARLEPKLTKGLREKGFVSFGILEAGFVYAMSNKPITKISDIKDSKPWVPENDKVGRALFESMGVSPVPVAIPDVMVSLQTGLIDAVANSPVGALALQWFTKVKYLTETPLLYAYGTLAISQKAWQKLSEKDQIEVERILTATTKAMNEMTRHDNVRGLATLKSQGIKFVQLEPGELEALQKLADGIIKKFIDDGDLDPGLVAEARAAINSVRQGK